VTSQAVGEEWWRGALCYQVYPRSFQDSDGDGIGDIPGIIARLDYLNDGTERSLGVDAIWLSPTYPSPMKDFGYDISDYVAVHPDFGTMSDMEQLIAECHTRGIRVLLDFVPNHSSDQHPWFIESRSSRHSPKRDWYYWRSAKADGSPPNNWISIFGGPAWTWDVPTGQYYLHSFLAEQPDLNWRNPEVVAAMHDVLRFWLDRGIDGFRIDVMGMVLKHPELADNPLDPEWRPLLPDYRRVLQLNSRNHPDVIEAVRGIRRVLDEYEGRVAVGEVFGTAEQIAWYYGGEALDGLHLAFNFQLINEVDPPDDFTPWEAETIARIINNAQRATPGGGHLCFALGNHDRSRLISRMDHDGRGRERARAAALLHLGLPNTPFIYYGEEIGMVDVDIPEQLLQDPARFRHGGRDPERTPMQWDASAGRGFSTAEPWLPYGPVTISVAAEQEDAGSLLNLYRRASWMRKREAPLREGRLRDLTTMDGVLSFARHTRGSGTILVVVNTASQPRSLPLAGPAEVILATHTALEGAARDVLQLPALAAAWIALPDKVE